MLHQMIAQLQAEPLYLMSVVKPVLMLLVLGPWAWLVGRLDKDAGYYYLEQKKWGMAHLGAGIVGFGVMLLVPIFWISWPLGMLILAGEIFGYITFRNGKVPEGERWSGMGVVKKVQAERENKAVQRAIVQANVKLLTKDEVRLTIPHGDDPRTPAFVLFQNMVGFAIPRGADRLDISTSAEKAVFVARIDGIRYPQEAPDPALSVQLIDYLKEHAGMDLTDRRRKQTGRMWVEVDGHGRHTLDLTTAGSTRALQLAIDIDAEGRLEMPIEKLGFLPDQFEAVEKLTKELSRVVLFASPPRQGMTTTMYSLLQQQDPYTSSVVTFEEKMPFEVEGVSHNLFPEGASNEQILAEFSSLLRTDPNVMLISRLVSTEMAQLITRQAEEARFYIPLPGKDTLSALKNWIKVCGDKAVAAESLSAIISQRLVRKLCVVCRAPYQPDAAAMKKLNITEANANQLFKASGKVVMKDSEVPCSTCQGLGYRGRIGVFELMIIDDEARALIAAGEDDRLLTHLRKQHMVYLQEAALAKVVEGICDIKEVTRVMSENQKG